MVQHPPDNARLGLGECATLACVLEATAPKPGNVHRGADFEDLNYLDLVLSGIAIGPAMERAVNQSLGQTVLAAIQATRRFVETNTNLGMVLLLAPLCAAATSQSLSDGVQTVLDQLSSEDARRVYQAIRLANPGAIGKVSTADVAGVAPESLVAAMQLSAERDLVARQYANSFAEVFGEVVPSLRESLLRHPPLDAIVYSYLQFLAQHPDSLIARKCGQETAQRASDHAASILTAAQPGDDTWHRLLADFDFWLRSDGHRRNPGTTADLITAGLFVVLWEGALALPIARSFLV
jgi:triphosphoribosyl-dephospho-CoA synthase